MEIRFKVPAVPVPQPRARATNHGGHARMYEAKKEHPIHAFKASVRLAAAQVHQGRPIEGPISLTVKFILPRPKLPKKVGTCRLPHTKRGDVDNLLKGVMDALNKTLWLDDAQVFQAVVSKEVAAVTEPPHVEVVIYAA